mgnify:CR=1 FL=1
MCVGVAVTLAPPSAMVCGWCLWHTGENVVLSNCRLSPPPSLPYASSDTPSKYDAEHPPRQTFLTYGVGVAVLTGTFLLQDSAIQRWEATADLQQQEAQQFKHSAKEHVKHFLPHKNPTQAFQPPQTPQELVERLGRPLLSRLAAASFSFFCAGAVQTYLAAKLQSS